MRQWKRGKGRRKTGSHKRKALMDKARESVQKLNEMKKDLENYFFEQGVEDFQSIIDRLTNANPHFRETTLKRKRISSNRKLLRIFIKHEPTRELKRKARELLNEITEQ